MEAILGLMLMYSVGITIAFFCVLKSRNRYVSKSEFLTRKIKEMMEHSAVQRPVSKPVVQQPVQQSEASKTEETKPAFVPAEAPRPQTVASVPTPTPAPKPVAPAPQPKEKKVTAIGVSFAVGVLLLVISAAVFISATWHTLAPGIKCVVLMGVVAVVYGLSAFSRKKLDLDKTGSGLFVLGNLLVPMAIVVGFMAFDMQSETYIMLLSCALSFVLTGFIGYKIFGTKFHVAVGYFGFVWSVIFICMQTIEASTGFVLGICTAALLTGIVYFVAPKLKFFDWFAEISCYAAVSGFIGAFFLTKDYYYYGLVAQIFFFVSAFLITRRRDFMKYITPFIAVAILCDFGAEFSVKEGYIIYAITFILATVAFIALYKLTKQETFVSNIAFAGGIPVCMWILYASELSKTHNILFYTIYMLPVLLALWVLLTSKISIERKCYCYYLALNVVIMCRNLIPDSVTMYLLLAFMVVCVAISLRKNIEHLVIASGAAYVCNLIVTGADNSKLIQNNVTPIVMAGIAAGIYVAYVFLNRSKDVKGTSYHLTRISIAAVYAVTGMILLTYSLTNKELMVPLVFIIVINALFIVASLVDVDNYLGAVGVFFLTVKIASFLQYLGLSAMITGLIIGAVYVVIGRLLVCEKVFSKNRIDWFTVAAFVTCFLPYDSLSKILVILTFYSLTFIGRFGEEGATLEEKLLSKLRIILSISLFLAAFVFVALEVDYSDIIDLEIRLAILIAVSIVVSFIIRPGKGAKWIFFTVICLSLELEAMKSVSNRDPIPLSLITVGSLGIFIYSFIARKRSWFIASIVMISQIGVFFAIEYWEDKLWWIYLLGMGAIMIVTASINEFRRRNSASVGEEKKKKLFADWTW